MKFKSFHSKIHKFCLRKLFHSSTPTPLYRQVLHLIPARRAMPVSNILSRAIQPASTWRRPSHEYASITRTLYLWHDHVVTGSPSPLVIASLSRTEILIKPYATDQPFVLSPLPYPRHLKRPN